MVNNFNSFNLSFEKNTNLNYGLYSNYFGNETSTFIDLEYIEIPLEIKFRLIKGKSKTSLITGINHSLLTDSKINGILRSTGNTTNANNITINKTALATNFGLEFKTNLNKRFSLGIEPMFKYYLKPVKETIKTNIFTLSGSVGIEYKF